MRSMSIHSLERRIAKRARERPDNSYTAELLKDGVVKCAKKVGEEAVEVVLAATSGSKRDIVGEAADLLYHLLVTLRKRKVTMKDIERELGRRAAQKAGNPKSDRRGT